MFSAANPLKRHHFSGYQLHASASEPVKSRIPIALAA
jgi:hypothetical protein